jgi:broad specificity phosphatase PhoE
MSGAMAKLILIKHAPPQVEPGVPSHEWKLSEAGRAKAASLAERLRPHAPAVVFTSDEPKAVETAAIVAAALNVKHEVAAGLHEHDRSNVPQMPTREFISSMALFFKRPAELILGRETADQARQRIGGAIDAVVAKNEGRDVAIVTHGTVLALYLAPVTKADPFELWRRLGLPSFVVVDCASVVETLERVD